MIKLGTGIYNTLPYAEQKQIDCGLCERKAHGLKMMLERMPL